MCRGCVNILYSCGYDWGFQASMHLSIVLQIIRAALSLLLSGMFFYAFHHKFEELIGIDI